VGTNIVKVGPQTYAIAYCPDAAIDQLWIATFTINDDGTIPGGLIDNQLIYENPIGSQMIFRNGNFYNVSDDIFIIAIESTDMVTGKAVATMSITSAGIITPGAISTQLLADSWNTQDVLYSVGNSRFLFCAKNAGKLKIWALLVSVAGTISITSTMELETVSGAGHPNIAFSEINAPYYCVAYRGLVVGIAAPGKVKSFTFSDGILNLVSTGTFESVSAVSRVLGGYRCGNNTATFLYDKNVGTVKSYGVSLIFDSVGNYLSSSLDVQLTGTTSGTHQVIPTQTRGIFLGSAGSNAGGLLFTYPVSISVAPTVTTSGATVS
jgi:hypothetical protein